MALATTSKKYNQIIKSHTHIINLNLVKSICGNGQCFPRLGENIIRETLPSIPNASKHECASIVEKVFPYYPKNPPILKHTKDSLLWAIHNM